MDLYSLLGLAPGASPADLKRAYRRLARRYHPGINPGDRAAESLYGRISEAYETLADVRDREDYVRGLHTGQKSGVSDEVGRILQAESREEIFADKLVAFALRANRVKFRDVWDLAWLHQQGVKPSIDLVPAKLQDHHCPQAQFLRVLDARRLALRSDAGMASGFRQEMRRFLPADLVSRTADQPPFWDALTALIDDLCVQTRLFLSGATPASGFPM